MPTKKTQFEITLSYRAVIQINVKADNEEDAKKKALDYFNNYRHFGSQSEIADDNYSVQGILNKTETWDKLYE